jgi:hypothetical protein
MSYHFQSEEDWLVHVLGTIFQSPSWTVPISSWIDEHCVVFDNEREHKHVFNSLHKEFLAFVESRLESALLALGLDGEVLVALAAASPPHSRLRRQIDEVMVCDDFDAFKRLMVARNRELEAAALAALEGARRRAPPLPLHRALPVVQLQDDEEALASALAASLSAAEAEREDADALAAAIAASLVVQAPRDGGGGGGVGSGSGVNGAPLAALAAAALRAPPPPAAQAALSVDGGDGEPSSPIPPPPPPRAAPPLPPPPVDAPAAPHPLASTLSALAGNSRASLGLPPPPGAAPTSALAAALGALPPLPTAPPPRETGAPVVLVAHPRSRGDSGGSESFPAAPVALQLPGSGEGLLQLPPVQRWGGHGLSRPLAAGPAIGEDAEAAAEERARRAAQLGVARAAVVEKLAAERATALATAAGGAAQFDRERVVKAAGAVIAAAAGGGAGTDPGKASRDREVMARIQREVMPQHPLN